MAFSFCCGDSQGDRVKTAYGFEMRIRKCSPSLQPNCGPDYDDPGFLFSCWIRFVFMNYFCRLFRPIRLRWPYRQRMRTLKNSKKMFFFSFFVTDFRYTVRYWNSILVWFQKRFFFNFFRIFTLSILYMDIVPRPLDGGIQTPSASNIRLLVTFYPGTRHTQIEWLRQWRMRFDLNIWGSLISCVS